MFSQATALHLMEPSGETGRALSPVRSAIYQNVQTQSKQTIQRKKHLGFAEIKVNGPTPSILLCHVLKQILRNKITYQSIKAHLQRPVLKRVCFRARSYCQQSLPRSKQYIFPRTTIYFLIYNTKLLSNRIL